MPKTILIADDHDAVRRAIREAFTSEDDFEVCGEAQDGQDAIEKAERLRPDLIILDLSMPVMNGLEAGRALKARMPSAPIILFTLYVDQFLEQAARAAGIADVVSKNDHLSVLIHKVRGLLSRKAA
jgi:DNA-binding NarL/FixJ family response regulator